jgi:hypothetical protein
LRELRVLLERQTHKLKSTSANLEAIWLRIQSSLTTDAMTVADLRRKHEALLGRESRQKAAILQTMQAITRLDAASLGKLFPPAKEVEPGPDEPPVKTPVAMDVNEAETRDGKLQRMSEAWRGWNSHASQWSGDTVMNVFGDEFLVRFNADKEKLQISKVGDRDPINPLIEIPYEEMRKMSLRKAAQFLGERLLLLNPEFRQIYARHIRGHGAEDH